MRAKLHAQAGIGARRNGCVGKSPLLIVDVSACHGTLLNQQTPVKAFKACLFLTSRTVGGNEAANRCGHAAARHLDSRDLRPAQGAIWRFCYPLVGGRGSNETKIVASVIDTVVEVFKKNGVEHFLDPLAMLHQGKENSTVRRWWLPR
jgi:hypothetical protein